MRYYVTEETAEGPTIVGEVVADPIIHVPGVPLDHLATIPTERAAMLDGDRIWTLEQLETDPAGADALRRWNGRDDSGHERHVRAELAGMADDDVMMLAESRDTDAARLIGGSYEERARYLYERAAARSILRDLDDG